MAERIRTGDPHGFNKECSSNFHIDSRVQQTPEEGQRTYRLKHRGNNNEDEDNSPKTPNDKKIISIYINFLKDKIYTVFKAKAWICSPKNITYSK